MKNNPSFPILLGAAVLAASLAPREKDKGSNEWAVDAEGNPLKSDQRRDGFPRIVGETLFDLATDLLVGAVLVSKAVSQANYEPARIGFVDVAQVFQNYKRAAQIQQDVRAKPLGGLQRVGDRQDREQGGDAERNETGETEWRCAFDFALVRQSNHAPPVQGQ